MSGGRAAPQAAELPKCAVWVGQGHSGVGARPRSRVDSSSTATLAYLLLPHSVTAGGIVLVPGEGYSEEHRK